eukprot:602245-Rhodomonas_salina.1
MGARILEKYFGWTAPDMVCAPNTHVNSWQHSAYAEQGRHPRVDLLLVVCATEGAESLDQRSEDGAHSVHREQSLATPLVLGVEELTQFYLLCLARIRIDPLDDPDDTVGGPLRLVEVDFAGDC